MSISGEVGLHDEDRLPWLETVDEEHAAAPQVVRTILFVLLGLVAIAAVLYGIYWYQDRHGPGGKGALITAPKGDYKVKPDSPGGMKVEGEGDTVFATSQGTADGNAQIDLKGMPETPVTATRPADAAATPVVAAPTTAAAAAAAAAAPIGPHGAVVQLGSFPSEAEANTAWAQSSKRFAYLAPLGKSVQVAMVNGRTVYRLRVNAGSASAAGELCGKLKVAGEDCFIP